MRRYIQTIEIYSVDAKMGNLPSNLKHVFELSLIGKQY